MATSSEAKVVVQGGWVFDMRGDVDVGTLGLRGVVAMRGHAAALVDTDSAFLPVHMEEFVTGNAPRQACKNSCALQCIVRVTTSTTSLPDMALFEETRRVTVKDLACNIRRIWRITMGNVMVTRETSSARFRHQCDSVASDWSWRSQCF